MVASKTIAPHIKAGALTGRSTPIYARITANDVKVLPVKSNRPLSSQNEKKVIALENLIEKIEAGVYSVDDKRALVEIYNKEIQKIKQPAGADITLNNENGREYNGFLSPQSIRKILSILSHWTTSLKVLNNDKGAIQDRDNVKFVTLTLPSKQNHTDKELKAVLSQTFIKTLVRSHGVNSYFWRAEPQKNGNIHFHVLIDSFVHYKTIQHIWNKALKPLGYIEQYRKNQQKKYNKGFFVNQQILHLPKHTAEKQRAAYNNAVRCNWSNPPSTEIRQVQKVENIESYLIKYMVKDDCIRDLNKKCEKENRKPTPYEIKCAKESIKPISGRLWGCSDNLRDLKKCEILISEDTRGYFENKIIEKKAKMLDFDYASVIKINAIAEIQNNGVIGEYFEHVHLWNYYNIYCTPPNNSKKPIEPTRLLIPFQPKTKKAGITYDKWKVKKAKIERENKKRLKKYRRKLVVFNKEIQNRQKNINRIPQRILETFETGFLSFQEFKEYYYDCTLKVSA